METIRQQIDKLNISEQDKKCRRFGKTIQKDEPDKMSYNLKKFLMMKEKNDQKNAMKYASKRLAEFKVSKKIKAKEDFDKRYEEYVSSMFKVEWKKLNKALKQNRINKYTKETKLHIDQLDLKTVVYDTNKGEITLIELKK